mmetsp:Transcript_10262/g.18906  ORF Transcript_10262/g.18906 Transcript_10262/m.18906 type:complete len:634 (-) Transcript_10262:161-2062(-)
MKTTMRLAIFAIVLTGADALSLRGHPSLLQAKLPLPQNSTAKEQEKTLGDMEATLMRMAKSGHVGTPLKNFADLIMPHLTSMDAAINTSHTTDQTTMDSYGTAFTTCTTAKTTADSEASTLLATKGTQSTAHKNCRTSEGTAQTNYANCVTAMNSLETSKNIACDAYDLANKVPNMNLVPQPGQGASYRSWLVSVRDWVINELATLDAAHASCVNATGLYNNKTLECEGANGQGGLWLVHNSLKTQCNANQTALESTTCSYASKVETSCSDYSTCHANAKSSYDSGKANLLSAQNNRILEYNLVKRLMCFCNLFSQADGADLASADIDTCKNTNHSATHLMLTLPSPPPVPGACQAVLQKPCTSSYTSTEYGSLPSNAQAATCQACPSASTTTTTAAPQPVGVCYGEVMDNPANRGASFSNTYPTRAACGQKCLSDGAAGFSYWTNGQGSTECRCGKAGKTFAEIMTGYAVSAKRPCKVNDVTTFNWCTCETGKPLPMSQAVISAIMGTVTAPFVVVGDHVELPGPAYTPCGTGTCGGQIEFQMDCPSSATVSFKGEGIAPDGRSDSFYIQVDTQALQTWHTGSSPSGSWKWSSASPVFSATQGIHTVTLKGREDGIKIKSLAVSGVCVLQAR